MPARLQGLIFHIPKGRNFGFIRTPEQRDAIVHRESVEPESQFHIGAMVEYTRLPARQGTRNDRAVQVVVLVPSPASL